MADCTHPASESKAPVLPPLMAQFSHRHHPNLDKHFVSGTNPKGAFAVIPISEESARFNPLQEIRLDANLIKDVQNIATMIVDPDGKGLNDHWAKTGFDLMTGVVLFVLLYWEPQGPDVRLRCLHAVQAILSDGGPIKDSQIRAVSPKPSGFLEHRNAIL